MDYNDLSLFLRVVEQGSFTATAHALGIQKSSVTRGIARLEEDLGARLIQRTTHQRGLTDAGRALYDRVKGAFASVDDAINAVRDIGDEPNGVVRMTASPDAAGLGTLPDTIASFVARYPKIHVELILTTRIVDLVAEGIDLALRAGPLADSTLVAKRIGTASLALYAAPGYLRRRGRPKRLSDLAQHDCVLFRGRSGAATWNLVGPNGPERVLVKGPVSADDYSFVLRAVCAGVGIALLPTPFAAPRIKSGQMERVLSAYETEATGLSVVMPSTTFLPSRVALLRDFLAANTLRERE